jgi:hypothetical protein
VSGQNTGTFVKAGAVATRIAKFLPVVAIGIGLVASAIWTTALVWFAVDGLWSAAFNLATAL